MSRREEFLTRLFNAILESDRMSEEEEYWYQFSKTSFITHQ